MNEENEKPSSETLDRLATQPLTWVKSQQPPPRSTDPLPDRAKEDIVRYHVAINLFRADLPDDLKQGLSIAKEMRSILDRDPLVNDESKLHPDALLQIRQFKEGERVIHAKAEEWRTHRSRQFRAACDRGDLTPLIYNASSGQICWVVGEYGAWSRLGFLKDGGITDDFVHPLDRISPGPFAGFNGVLHRVFFRKEEFDRWRAMKLGAPAASIDPPGHDDEEESLGSCHAKTISEAFPQFEWVGKGAAAVIKKCRSALIADRMKLGLGFDGKTDATSTFYTGVNRALKHMNKTLTDRHTETPDV